MKHKQLINKFPLLIHGLYYQYTNLYFKLQQICRINFPKPQSIYFYCKRNYGDHIQNMAYLNSLARSNNNKNIFYAIKASHIDQIKDFSYFDNLKIIRIQDSPYNSINLWKNSNLFWTKNSLREFYYDFYLIFFYYISKKINIVNPIKSKRDLLIDIPYNPKKSHT